MKIILNGIEKPLKEAMSIIALLEDEGFADKLVAIAVNGAFVPKSDHARTILSEGDRVEIVAPMQGG